MSQLSMDVRERLANYLRENYSGTAAGKTGIHLPKFCNFFSREKGKKETYRPKAESPETEKIDAIELQEECTSGEEMAEAFFLEESFDPEQFCSKAPEPPVSDFQISAPEPFCPKAPEPMPVYQTNKRTSAPKLSGIGNFIGKSYEEDGVAKMLNLYMFQKDITTAMIYQRCFVDRRLISKITSGKGYHPSKNTILALCIGLQLTLPEGKEFLNLAGYSFSNASKYDLIIKFMLANQIYDLDVINEMLFEYDQPCIGTSSGHWHG